MEADRLPDGTLPAFWWILNWYTTAAWMETWDDLKRLRPETGTYPELELESTDLPNMGCTSLLDEALFLECALYSGATSIAAKTRKRLLDAQLPDGLWPVELALGHIRHCRSSCLASK